MVCEMQLTSDAPIRSRYAHACSIHPDASSSSSPAHTRRGPGRKTMRCCCKEANAVLGEDVVVKELVAVHLMRG